MANLFTNKKLPKRIAVIYKDLRNVTSKLHRTAGSIGFIRKALYHEVIPKFARVNGNFINKNEQYKSERSVLCSHLNEHVHTLKSLVSKHYVLKDKLKQVTGQLLYRSVSHYLTYMALKNESMSKESIKTIDLFIIDAIECIRKKRKRGWMSPPS